MSRIDSSLFDEVRKHGRFDVSGCFNCGSCTIRCDLTSDGAPFPRRSMQYAIVGLKKELRGSLEPWLCHDCGDCSEACPRDAEPRESMMTLRRYLTAQYDWTGLSAKIFKSKAWEIGSLFFIAVLFLALVVVYHLYIDQNAKGMPMKDFLSTSMGLEHMFGTITWFTRVVFLIPLILMATFALRMYFFIMKASENIHIPFRLYVSNLKTLFSQMFLQPKMKECPREAHKKRWNTHFMLVAGCFLMVFVKFFFLKWFQTDAVYKLWHPQRWLGYLAAAALLYATVDILIGRLRKKEEMHKFSELTDWTFPALLLSTALSGLVIHIARLTGWALTAHYAYAFHLMIVTSMVVVELPFGRWAHGIYRPLALYFQAAKEEALKGGPTAKEKAA